MIKINAKPTILLSLILFFFLVSGCAVMKKNLPSWESYNDADSGGDKEPITLAYQSVGEGDPILFIHGFGASSYSWRYLTEPLSQNRRVITIDLKGFGQSPKPRDGLYSIYEQARLVRDFILAQDLQNLTIIGHSYGGGVALLTSIQLSKLQPKRQKDLILIGNAAYPQKLPSFMRILATPILGPMVLYWAPNKIQVHSLLKKVYFKDDLIPEAAIDHYAKNMGQENAKYATLQIARQLMPGDMEVVTKQYTEVTVPTLIIWGSQDEIISPEIGKRLNAALPNSRLIMLDDVGHAPQEERPDLILPQIKEFLQ